LGDHGAVDMSRPAVCIKYVPSMYQTSPSNISNLHVALV
jgi:hypothetical protein